MSAFLKIDRCQACQREVSWEWVPPIVVGGRPLAGTGVWRSQLVVETCLACRTTAAAQQERLSASRTLTEQLIQVLGGIKPYRQFTFERYKVSASNERAYQKARNFDPLKDNLYLWGRGRVGKTHLAYAVARGCRIAGRSVAILTAAQLIRKLRMRSPDEEQQGIDGLVGVEVLVLDDLGVGSDTPYSRQILREILDARDFRDRAGLVVTSRYSLTALARFIDDSIFSRLETMCQVVEITQPNRSRPSSASASQIS